jgi:hypothetical protein
MDPVADSDAGAAQPGGPDSPRCAGRLDAAAQGADGSVGFLTGNPSVQQWKGQVFDYVPSLRRVAELCRWGGSQEHATKWSPEIDTQRVSAAGACIQ